MKKGKKIRTCYSYAYRVEHRLQYVKVRIEMYEHYVATELVDEGYNKFAKFGYQVSADKNNINEYKKLLVANGVHSLNVDDCVRIVNDYVIRGIKN